jgi:hypothetical protein
MSGLVFWVAGVYSGALPAAGAAYAMGRRAGWHKGVADEREADARFKDQMRRRTAELQHQADEHICYPGCPGTDPAA